jgi:hypothetical protein
MGEQLAAVAGIGNLSLSNLPYLVLQQFGLTDNK